MSAFYATQSPVTDPGALADWSASVGPSVEDIQRASSRFVFHYRGGGDFAENGVPADRVHEIDLRYAEDMLRRLRERNDDIEADRRPAERTVGCCRDFTVLFVALARQRGIPARARVGFAGYFDLGWWVDHVVAEVLVDGAWRLVEAQIPPGWVDPTDGARLDVYDLPRTRFLVGADAWAAAREGRLDHERFVVNKDLDEPFLRSWTQIAHNLVHDLAALNKQETLLWDTWGLVGTEPLDDAAMRALDRLAATLRAGGADETAFAAAYDDPDFRVPETVTSHSPATHEESTVTLRR